MSYTRVVHLLQLKNLHWHIIITQSLWLELGFTLHVEGEGNGNPLQYACLENPVDREAWWGWCPWGHTELDTTEVT